MANRATVMNSIIADKTMDRAPRNLEAQRLSNLTGRAIDWRTVDCRCDENPFCDRCSGLGAYHEAFYLSCNHPVIDGADLECEVAGCAEREARKAEAA
jgi:hypothetical protein